MKLININRLSDQELKYIAEQEGIEEWETLSRTELIEALEEFYGEDESELLVDKKYVRAITAIDSDVSRLPGIRPLPDFFNETGIQIIMKDADWAYVIWNLDSNTKNRLSENNAQLFLNVAALKDKTREEMSYQIDVNMEDRSWSVEFPWKGRLYIVELKASYQEKTEVLATSSEEYVASVYFEKHPEVLKNQNLYKIITPALVTDGGEYIDCSKVKEILTESLL